MMLEGARILLVEDNEVNQKVAKRMLYCLGCQVTVAGNGEVCLSVLDEAIEPFDVILMDCQVSTPHHHHQTPPRL
jgi:CheY-like chemotaxis protein